MTDKEQIAINSALWFNASPAGKDYLHKENLRLQARIDAANNTVTVYKESTGTYVTTPASTITPPIVTKIVDKVVVALKDVGFGVIVEPIKAVGDAITPTGTLNTAIQDVTSELDKRKAEAAAFTGWDNDSSIRGKQMKSWDIYIATGRWDSAEQKQLYADAEAMRKALNLTYKGSPWGTTDKAAADLLILPDTQPVLGSVSGSIFGGLKNALVGTTSVTGGQIGSVATLGVFAVGTFFVLSLFRGRH